MKMRAKGKKKEVRKREERGKRVERNDVGKMRRKIKIETK